MSLPDLATQQNTVMDTPFRIHIPNNQIPETTPKHFTFTPNCKELVMTELTYEGRTFEFNRPLRVRVLEKDGGWTFECDDPELIGFGHTRAEAEETFCLGFTVQWDDLVCSKDGRLTEDAKEIASKLLALVKTQK